MKKAKKTTVSDWRRRLAEIKQKLKTLERQLKSLKNITKKGK